MCAGDCGGKNRAGVGKNILPVGITEQGEAPAWVSYLHLL